MRSAKFRKRQKTVQQYDQEYDELITHAVHRYGDQRKVAHVIREFLSSRKKHDFSYANVHARQVFRNQLKASVAQHWPTLKAREVPFGFLTFLNKEWVCNEGAYVDLALVKRKVRKAMGGVNFIAVIEHACYVNVEVAVHKIKAKMICVHVHAIAWDTSYRQLQRRRTSVQGRFTSPFAQCKKPVHLAKRVGIDEFMATADYCTKMNVSGYRVEKDGRTQRSAKLSYQSHFNLFRLTHSRKLFDYWFGGGEGSAVLRHAKAACLAKRPLTERELADFIDDARDYEAALATRHKRRKKAVARSGRKWQSVPVRSAGAAPVRDAYLEIFEV